MSGRCFSGTIWSLLLAFTLLGCATQPSPPSAQAPSAPAAVQPTAAVAAPQPTAPPPTAVATQIPTAAPLPTSQVPVGKIVAVLISKTTGKPVANEKFGAVMVFGSDMVDDATCTLKKGATFPALEAVGGGRSSGMDQVAITDANGKILLPGKERDDEMKIPADTVKDKTFYVMLAAANKKCYLLRDRDGNPIGIRMGTQSGVDLGEVFLPY